jgi:hypothetical protein
MSMATMSIETFRNLRLSAIALLLMVGVGAACVIATNAHLAKVQALDNAEQAKLNDITHRLNKAQDEEQEIRRRLALFEQLKARGVIGEEERLNWVEQIRRIKSERKLYNIEYDISPQHPVSDKLLPGAGGSYEFYTSPMELHMDLLDEDDLLDFLAEFTRSVHAYVRVSRCSVERLPQAGGLAPFGPRLKADCLLDLITARERKSS